MSVLLMMLAVAGARPAATTHDASPARPAAERRGTRPAAMMRSREYLAYRLCLQHTAREAYAVGTIPEDLLPELHHACAAERQAMTGSPAFRAFAKPGEETQKEEELVTNLTSAIVAVEIRNYVFRYATGRGLGR